MVSGVGWLASVCSHPLRLTSRTPPDSWPRWKRRFEQFRLAAGLSTESDEKQDAEDTLSSTNITTADRKKYEAVIGKFDGFFKARKNIIFERARFNRRSQGTDESVEQFITALYSLAENCEYGALRDEMIRDRIVVGIRDRSLSERLQLNADLTLRLSQDSVRLSTNSSPYSGVVRNRN